MHRFLVESLADANSGDACSLPHDEARHLRTVLRLQVGNAVDVFDGEGWSTSAQVAAVDKRSATVSLTAAPTCEATASPAIQLAFAPPKADRLRFLVEKCTELGVDRLTPILTTRTIVKPGQGKLSKLRDAALQACKQSGRNRLPILDEPLSWADLIAKQSRCSEESSCLLLIADQAGSPLFDILPTSQSDRTSSITILIGPEGSFTADEQQQAVEIGARPVSFARHTLRIETAAIAAVACLSSIFPRGKHGLAKAGS